MRYGGKPLYPEKHAVLRMLPGLAQSCKARLPSHNPIARR